MAYRATPETPLKTYLFSYIHRGEVRELEVEAYSPGDAMVRIGKMADARLEGELVMEEVLVPVFPVKRTIISTQN